MGIVKHIFTEFHEEIFNKFATPVAGVMANTVPVVYNLDTPSYPVDRVV